ncbi:MAG: SpoIID/LytB domain-containing protein [Actinomycetota bacterium]|nr:SpoIID/LytB domain-containing protein [Actinomycetota bacterium]
MRPGGVRRTEWVTCLITAAALVGGTAATLVATAAPAQASITVKQTYGRPASGTYQLLGHGWGHGHGLSQYGAQGAATLGKTADQITATYYPNTARAVQGNPTMRILLSTDGRTTIREFVPTAGQVMRDLATATNIPLSTSVLYWRVTSNSSGLHVAYVNSTGTHPVAGTYAGPLQVSGGSFVRVRFSNGQGKDYRTSVRVLRSGTSSLRSIAVMPMESYLYGVVPRESSSSWAAPALQAQSIAARSYSQYKKDHVSSTQVYDICDTTQCQVFGGSASFTDANDATTRTSLEATSTSNAVKATAGVIRTYGGKAIFAEFSASNGGWSTDGGTPYLIAQADPWDGVTGSSVHSWKAALPVTSLECRYGPKNSDGTCAKRSDGTPAWRLIRTTITQRDGNGEWGGRVEAGVLDFVDSAGAAHTADATGSGFYNARTWPAYSDGLRSRWFYIVPEYDAAVVSRSTAPKLVLAPGNPKGTLTTVLKNTGNAPWPVSGLHLALASPAGGADPLAGGKTRPGAYVKNLTHPGATTVLPGDQAQFSVALDATGLPAGSRSTFYRPRIGTAALFGSKVGWTVSIAEPVFTGVLGAAPTLVSSTYVKPSAGPPALFADGRTVIVPRTGTTTLRLTTKNTGNLSWPVGSTSPVMLGASGPRGRTSSFATSSWVSTSRASRLAAASAVVPGGRGTFTLPLGGNSKAVGVSVEAFEPVWQGQSWITGHSTRLTVVRVDPAASRMAVTDLAPATGFTLVNAPTGRANLVLRLRNVGGQPWVVGQERLKASATPLAYHWAATDRPSTLSRNVNRPGITSVYPGEIGEWVIPVTGATARPGDYSFTVRPATPAGAGYGPSLTDKARVVAAVFSAQLQSVRSSVDVPSNGHAATYYYVKNTGNVVWSVGGALRSTVLAGSSPSHYTSWYSASRPGPLTSNLTVPGSIFVRPGEVGRFSIVLAGNGRAAQSRTELFGMSWDGWRSNPLSVTVAYRVV